MKLIYTPNVERCEIHLDKNIILVNPIWVNGVAMKYGISVNHVVLHELGHYLYNKKNISIRWNAFIHKYNDIIQDIIKTCCYMLKQLDSEEIFAEIYAIIKENKLYEVLKSISADKNRKREFETELLKLIYG